MAEKKLFLLDGYALIFRAYYAFIKNPRMHNGLNTSAMYGYLGTLLDLLEREKPTHIALGMDVKGPTLRAQEHSFYKANRQETPEDIKLSVPYILELTKAFNIPIVSKEGYEADDVIGTIAKAAEKEGFTVYMVTPDKDFGQLVSEKIFMYKPGRSGKPREIWGAKEICQRWQIDDPLQVIDILGMMGDASDNIPGIPGVGEKTAIKLLKEHKTMENLYLNTDKLKGKLKEKVENNHEQAIISKKLATIVLDVPVEYSLDSFIVEEPNKQRLAELFDELGFTSYAKRLLGPNAPTPTPKKSYTTATQGNLFGDVEPANIIESELVVAKKGKTIKDVEHDYLLVDTPEARAGLIKNLLLQKQVAFDTETTGLDANLAELVGMSFCWKTGIAYYVPFPDDQDEAKTLLAEFVPFFQNENITKIGQNIKYDMLVLRWYDVELKGGLSDTMLLHYLIEPDLRHNLDYLADNYLGYNPVSITELIGKKGKNQGTMRDVPLDKITEYASEDADITWQLHEKFAPQVAKESFQELYEKVEAPLVYVLTEMEYNGITLDKDFLDEYSVVLSSDIEKVKKQIFEGAETEFNLDSPKQLGEVLFDKMKIPYKGKKTKTGQYSTNEETLQKLADKHEIAKWLIDYRGLTKLRSTYVDALPKLINPKSGRIHSSFNQAVAATGRLSSTNPNLQNIPIRTERGREVRKAFVPRNEEYTLLAADYSQIELRIIAALSGDEAMIDAFKTGKDIHSATASKVYGVPLEEVTKDLRRNAKAVNFGIVYGSSAFGLAKNLGIKTKEGSQIIKAYFTEYPKIKEFMDKAVEQAREVGYVETIMGRRRYLRNINSRNATVRGFDERNAINAPIQGSAADMIKVAMVEIHQEMQKQQLKSKMILQVHDELVFDAHKTEVEKLKEILEDKMVNAIKMVVPIEIEIGLGDNWLQAH